MAGYRFWLQCSLSIVLALASARIGRSQLPELVESSVETKAVTCKVYSLADLGDDPKLCKWIAETIPEMIQPASWKQGDAKLSFYAPSKILVVNNTPAVHAKVDEFLQNLRKSLPQKASAKNDALLVPAQFALQDTSRPVSVVQTGPGSYPVPNTPVGPKHLFHFIIRYEGEGIIDANVAKLTEALTKEKTSTNSASYVFPPPPPPAGDLPPVQVVPGGKWERVPGDPPGQPVQGASGRTWVVPAAPPMPPADAPAPSKVLPPLSSPSNIPPVAQ